MKTTVFLVFIACMGRAKCHEINGDEAKDMKCGPEPADEGDEL